LGFMVHAILYVERTCNNFSRAFVIPPVAIAFCLDTLHYVTSSLYFAAVIRHWFHYHLQRTQSDGALADCSLNVSVCRSDIAPVTWRYLLYHSLFFLHMDISARAKSKRREERLRILSRFRYGTISDDLAEATNIPARATVHDLHPACLRIPTHVRPHHHVYDRMGK
jgi:hypothetical protein